MSRRNFLKGLTGLAGIIATAQSPAIVMAESLMALPQPKKLILPGDELITDRDEILLEMMHMRLAERAQRVTLSEDGERTYHFPDGSRVRPEIVESASGGHSWSPELYTGAMPSESNIYNGTDAEIARFKGENKQYHAFGNDTDDTVVVVPEEFSARVAQLNAIAAKTERAREIRTASSVHLDSDTNGWARHSGEIHGWELE